MLSVLKKMNMDSISSAWKGGPSCDGCSIRFNVFRRKRLCIFCKNFFCNLCIMRRPDKKFCCRKCQILTARPLDRNDLLNLRSRDLVNYLTSRHISTSGCVEKEDLVNVLMRAVNNSSFHASCSTHSDPSSCTNSYPNSPRKNSFHSEQPNAKRKLTQSVEDLSSHDGIRISGHNSNDNEVDSGHSAPCCDDGFEVIGTVNDAECSNDVSELFEREMATEGNIDFQSVLPSNLEEVESASLDNAEGDLLVENSSKPLMLSDINSYADLEALSVKQLKELLMRNRTDFKGCIERTELVEKASRLWSDYIISRKDLEKLSLDELCKICMDAPIECVLLECGHMATCTSCGKQLCECPICRQFVVRCVRTFKA